MRRVTTDPAPKTEIEGPDSVLSRAPWPGIMPPKPTQITLTAKGTPSGGKYTWSIVSGSDKIEMSDRGATATITGVKGSSSPKDVEVKVTYTIGISSASSTRKFTVRRPDSAKDFKFLDTRVQEDGRNYWRDVEHTLRDQFHDVINVAGIPIGERGTRIDAFGFAHVGRDFTTDEGIFKDHLESPMSLSSSKWHQTIKAGCMIIMRMLFGSWDVGHFYITFDYGNLDEDERIKKEFVP